MSARRVSGESSRPSRGRLAPRPQALLGRYQGAVVYAGALAVVAVAYYLSGRIGLELAYLDGAVAALWPPAGLGLAILVLFGVRLWPGIVIGDLLLADFSTPFGTVLAQTVGNTVALVLAALLLRRPHRRPRLAGARHGRAGASSGARSSRRWSAPPSARWRCAWAT